MWERSAGEGGEGGKGMNGIKERKKWNEGTFST
jgi:ribosomal protein L15